MKQGQWTIGPKNGGIYALSMFSCRGYGGGGRKTPGNYIVLKIWGLIPYPRVTNAYKTSPGRALKLQSKVS